jgi:NAD(P)-dependent dehydrogenase (short-subunit alcohol dehydrogenase family)
MTVNALVIGSSGGIGQALAARLRVDLGADAVATLSRSEDGFDLREEVSIAQAARDLGDRYGAFDLIISATGALMIDRNSPEKTIKALSSDAMMAQFRTNAIGPALMLKHFHPLLPRKTRSVFASLSARVGSIGDNRLGGWIFYCAAKAAQNQIIKTGALEIARTRPQAIVVALDPGTVATQLSRPFSKSRQKVAPDYAAARLLEGHCKAQPNAVGRIVFLQWAGDCVVAAPSS